MKHRWARKLKGWQNIFFIFLITLNRNECRPFAYFNKKLGPFKQLTSNTCNSLLKINQEQVLYIVFLIARPTSFGICLLFHSLRETFSRNKHNASAQVQFIGILFIFFTYIKHSDLKLNLDVSEVTSACSEF